ncbi:MAG TPA: cytochrome C oxidase subunit IV family protein [Thermomicrobiales bacterium]|nr:cytochrome C oxidase subunit IV family protein [Thermomicrobiales bacterium]
MSAMHVESQAEDAAHDHPSDKVYFTMLGILAVFTVVELLIFYAIESVVLRILILATFLVIKFVAQVGWFTHLRYDDRRLTWVFGGCFFIALAVMAATVVMMAFDGFHVGIQYD